ncbi:MAG: lipid-A-disaccharide synthase [Alphaproteobacteria bacterium]|nr:lipid-A-disaccharide synthase [Alphaproteobacteria bacterium]
MSIKNKKVFIIAGEVSGDVLGAKIIQKSTNIDFVGIGGENMINAGLNSIFPMSDLAVMGIIEVALHAKTLTKRIKETVSAILHEKPDVVLTIDSPGFARAVIKSVRKKLETSNYKPLFYHVVAPQVWAWRPKRAKKYADIFDKLYAFFDFEIPYFTKYDLNTVAIGHPIVDGVVQHIKENKVINKDINTITFAPGSRLSEIKKLLPLFKKVTDELALNYPKLNNIFIPIASKSIEQYIKKHISRWKTKPSLIPANQRYDIYSQTDIAIAASGTVTVELALMQIPTIVVYKMNFITTLLIKSVILVKWVSLINILLNKTVFPELLGPKATSKNILDAFVKMKSLRYRKKIMTDLQKSKALFSANNKDGIQKIIQDI